ncbi:F-box protein SKIP14 [Pistacia vera]|uniref:F-box protein SKIP14 n=1 Tax=Pistacia vera TaxID=55513 RepID=UPI001263AFAD|nr:F-box protein SKIP14 [Pistacia vera]
MALNFSHRPIFPTHLSEDNMVAPMRIANGYLVEGIPEKNGDGFKNWHSNREMEDCFDNARDRGCNRCVSQESVSKDILDLLPSDPFGMDISTTFTAAITGWLEDLEDYGGYGMDEVGTSDGNCQLLAELNFFWNNAMRFQGFPGNMGFEHNLNVVSGSAGCFLGKEVVGETSCHGSLESACNVDDILSYGNENVGYGDQRFKGLQEGYGSYHDKEGGAPHPALYFALGYLGMRDLLLVERVCRSLCSTVRSDPLLWRSIHIDQPLNEKITDDVLLQLTNRAQGNLQCLSLVECLRITDDGLKRVLENNPRLTKLSVPGCTRLSIEGIINSLKAFKSMGAKGVKHLRIGGLYGVTPKHFEELKLLLGTDCSMHPNVHKPHFYHRGNFYLSCEDERAIDIEMCPRCLNLRLVYDCPAEGCQGEENITQLCRACTLCIARCAQCGRCINDSEYEETFCLQLLCSDCGKQLLKCQERQVRRIGPSKSPVSYEPCSGLCHHG